MKHTTRFVGSMVAGAFLVTALAGCATSRTVERALVCPQCKEVAIERCPRAISPDEEVSYPYWEREWTRVEHSCPGCQGVLTTFFKEGKWQHKCSICAETPFSCPISHR